MVANALLTPQQIEVALRYGAENHLELPQAILELNMISPDRLNALAFERLTSLVQTSGTPVRSTENQNLPVPASPLLPDRISHHLDIRNELKELAATATLPSLVHHILGRALDSRATDVHFDPNENGVRVRFRIDGQLQDVLDLESTVAQPVVVRLKVMSDLNIVDRRHPQDGRITLEHSNRHRDLRVATFPTAMGEKLVVRIHNVLTDAHGFDHLGMTAAQAAQLGRLVSHPYGAILVAGPVGSGKTTTLYTGLSMVNSSTRNVMTIEDPIENRVPGINQTEVNADMNFHDGLRSMLRQDPDVIMIGEIRDDETARIGIRAAMTGVLVFSSMHGSDSPSTIGNLHNFGVPGYLLSNSLLAVVSQRLVRKICPYCRVSRSADAKLLTTLGLDPDEHEGLVLYRGLGCPACFQTGYLGRTGIFEIMEVSEELRELIFQQVPKDVLRRVAVDLGMRTLEQSAVDKVLEGVTTVEEFHRVVSFGRSETDVVRTTSAEVYLNAWFDGKESGRSRLIVGEASWLSVNLGAKRHGTFKETAAAYSPKRTDASYTTDYVDVQVLSRHAHVAPFRKRMSVPPSPGEQAEFEIVPRRGGPLEIAIVLLVNNEPIHRMILRVEAILSPSWLEPI